MSGAVAGASLSLPVAHAGHWYFWPLYALPLGIVLWSVVKTTIRERRAARDDQDRETGA